MSDRPRLKYEKPVSLDLGRVAPVLGAVCSVGSGAKDCIEGSAATSPLLCSTGGGAASCNPHGGGAAGSCIEGNGASS